MRRFGIICLAFFLLLGSSQAFAASGPQDDEDLKRPSGLPLPRFASLRSDEVNLRAGPGTRYPIAWVFTKEGLPVEITAEFEIWRRVRDSEGSEGWVHKSTLTGKRAMIVTGGTKSVFTKPDDSSAIAAKAEAGAIGQLLSCENRWCKVKFPDIKGYMKKEDFWGAYENETLR